MKWLFALLVAINIAVFGSMVATRLGNNAQKTAQAPIESGTHELQPPPTVALTPASAPPAAPEWVASSAPAVSSASEPAPEPEAASVAVSAAVPQDAAQQKAEEEKAAKAKAEKEKAEKEKADKLAKEKEKKEKEEKAKREAKARREQADNADMPSERPARAQQCSTAAISLDEDDYHRLKGLLNRWPHAATRSVEQRSSKTRQQGAVRTYRVLVPGGGDIDARLESLNAKGFGGSAHNGEISIAVTRSRSSAQVLISRLRASGFGGAHIMEQMDSSNIGGSGALSVARMHVTFTSVDAQTAQDIRAVVGRYGNLNVKNCK
ncbi:cell division protein [Neisseria sp.]|uniref:cell division protein n=1 Tax=Neisseria sp. TaxID=192066 RepID=UPI0035A12D64